MTKGQIKEYQMLESVRKRTPDSYILTPVQKHLDDGLVTSLDNSILVICRNTRILAEFNRTDRQRMAELARIYGLEQSE